MVTMMMVTMGGGDDGDSDDDSGVWDDYEDDGDDGGGDECDDNNANSDINTPSIVSGHGNCIIQNRNRNHTNSTRNNIIITEHDIH